MNETENLTAAAPADIDARLADLAARWHSLEDIRVRILDSLHSAIGERGPKHGKVTLWPTTAPTMLDIVRERLDHGAFPSHLIRQVRDQLVSLELIRAGQAANNELAAVLSAEYNRRQWARFFIVDGGHIHATARCTGDDVRPATKIAWCPELSGKNERAAVVKFGPLLCLKCFPFAPVEYTWG